MTERSTEAFEHALAELPNGYCEGLFGQNRWRATIRRSDDGKRVWLYAEALGSSDIVSFNFYRLSATGATLKPCEMSSDKVIDFVLGFELESVRQKARRYESDYIDFFDPSVWRVNPSK